MVRYNIPFRDCAQYSAGGATSVAEYGAWIHAVAAGIGTRDGVVLLEPDGLWSTRRPGRGSRSRRSSWLGWPSPHCDNDR
jgi:cellulase/cellobiase CelA1